MNPFDVLSEHGFVWAGEILRTDKLRFALAEDHIKRGKHRNVHGWVYAWVVSNPDGNRVVYIGMAGKNLKKRCGEHENGFANGRTGMANAALINECFTKYPESRIMVYARKSGTIEVMGETVCAVGIEETAMIAKGLRLGWPLWNREI